jgi:CheY-like chemotaxis protein
LVKDLEPVPSISLAAGRLDQVLTNLLMNAAQAIPEGVPRRHQITVSTRTSGAEVVIAVEDTGSGMSDEEQRHVFEPFFTTKPRGEGTGLGLSICADIVGAYGGSIGCSSAPAQGSRFEVRFPYGSATKIKKKASVPPARAAAPRTRVLLVDDEPYIRQTYAMLLEGEFDVMTAGDGTQALSFMEADPSIDLVICDVMMPDMDAAQMLGRVRARCPDLASRFVLHTGGAMNERTRQLVDSGEFPVFYKPVTLADMITSIRRLVQNRVSDASG